MRVLLVKPINKKLNYYYMPNLGLGYLATSLRKYGHDVRILDCLKERFGFNEFKDYLKKFNPEFVGIQAYACDYNTTKKMLSIVKEHNSKTITAIGGPQVTADPKWTFNNMSNADFGFIHETDNNISLLLNKTTSLESIPGLIYREKNNININTFESKQNLDRIGFPAWDLMNPNEFPTGPQGLFARKTPVAPIITSIGCPYKCSYCVASLNSKNEFRRRNVNNIIQEIKLLNEKYGVKEIHIEDDNFTLNKKQVMDFCNKIISMKLKIYWACPNGVRLDTLDKEVLQLMEKAGCYSFAVGIESGSPKILKKMNRSITLEKIVEKVKLIKKVTNIKITGFFIMGYPGETINDMRMTKKLAMSLPIHKAMFNNFIPYKGTKIFQELVENGEIDENNMLNYHVNTKTLAYNPSTISSEKLSKIIRNAFLRFYLRPRIIISLLFEIRSFDHVKIIIKRILGVLF